jgi:predicted RNase H-like nuclease (RuvC/YqgF family)
MEWLGLDLPAMRFHKEESPPKRDRKVGEGVRKFQKKSFSNSRKMTQEYITKGELLEELKKHEEREEKSISLIFERLGKLENNRSSSDQIINFLRDEIKRLREELEKISKKLEQTFLDGVRSRIVTALFSTIGTAVLTAFSVKFFLQ